VEETRRNNRGGRDKGKKGGERERERERERGCESLTHVREMSTSRSFQAL
jgi:hypothetical protein